MRSNSPSVAIGDRSFQLPPNHLVKNKRFISSFRIGSFHNRTDIQEKLTEAAHYYLGT
ncbi:hypothetical protein Tco_0354069, partial [Tanacetum coccineum]